MTNFEATEREATTEKLFSLPPNYFTVLVGVIEMKDFSIGEIIQPVTTAKLSESQALLDIGLGDRAIRNLITALETMGLIETWIELKGNESRVKQVQTTFEPE